MKNRKEIISIRMTPENLKAARIVAALTYRTVSSLAEYALSLYITNNYPEAYKPEARLALKLDEAPTTMEVAR